MKKRFLAHFRALGNVTRACELAGIRERTTVYDWKTADPEFAAAYAAAEIEATEHLEAEAQRRATEGLVKKKFTRNGDPILDPETGEHYIEREYSDTLLIVLLKARAPEKYRERHEVTGKGGGPVQAAIQIEAVDYRAAIAPLAPEDAGS